MIKRIKNWFKPHYLEWEEYQKRILQQSHLKFVTNTSLKSVRNHWANIARRLK